MKTVLLIGSYSGQNSFGDVGLLRCVTTQLRDVFQGDVRFVSHVMHNLEHAREIAPEVEFHLGIMQLFWQWHEKLRHFHLPFSLHLMLTFLTLPFWLVAKQGNRRRTAEFFRDLRQCSFLYFYGGTQLSQQWFALNFAPLTITILATRLFGRPIYFGPQQYGPQTAVQSCCLRLFLKLFVTDIRVRNVRCSEMLKLPKEKLLFDEIYSCVARFPISNGRNARGSFLLANMRASNFIRDTNEQEFRAFVHLLAKLHHHTKMPIKLFQMSDATFSDDARVTEFLHSEGFGDLPLEVIPPFNHEHELIELARNAYGCVSMSFHGCILCMLAGCPAVPVTSGDYYDYKYIDFERYAGEQRVPVTHLTMDRVSEAAVEMISYFEAYAPDRTMAARQSAAKQIQNWYLQITRPLTVKK